MEPSITHNVSICNEYVFQQENMEKCSATKASALVPMFVHATTTTWLMSGNNLYDEEKTLTLTTGHKLQFLSSKIR